jgi:glycosyltransferase involved in cell wall biosynthesis
MTLVAVLAPEPVRPRMAGMGIRALELARVLAGRFEVRLLVPNAVEEARSLAGNLTVVGVAGGLSASAAGADAAVVSGHAAAAWLREVPSVPAAVDLYDPYPIENLHYAAALGEAGAGSDRRVFALSLARGDFFLCASEEQRFFYAGALYAAGRVGPRNFPSDPGLSRLLAVVPFGVPSEPASGDRARGRAAAGVPPTGPLILFGGIYDWYDPETLLRAWPRLRRLHPDARLLFFENPNPETTPQRAMARTRAEARRLDPAGESIVFSPWLPYDARADLYAASDVAVSIAADGLETDLAYRTRLLDAAWGGVPSVTVGGGILGRELEAAGASLRAAPDPEDLAKRIGDVLAARDRLGAAARRFASERTWERVARPLETWCGEATIDPGRRAFPDEAASAPIWKRLWSGSP